MTTTPIRASSTAACRPCRPALANPTAGGHPGGVIYESTCNCKFAKNYPWAFGPRLGVAYQITPKTVFRAGIGVAYDGTATAAYRDRERRRKQCVHLSGFWRCCAAAANRSAVELSGLRGPIYPRGPIRTPNIPAANGPTSVVDQNAGRPARQIQWSIGLQREITPNTFVEASYVGNRGAWWLSTVSDNYNALIAAIPVVAI